MTRLNKIAWVIVMLFCWALFCLGILWPVVSYGQSIPKECDPEDPKSCVQALLEGERAPFAGQLLTPRRAAKLAVLAEGCQAQIELAVEAEREMTNLLLDDEEALRASEAEGAQLQRDLLLKRIAALEAELTPPWYERTPVVAALSVAATVGVLVVSVYAVQATR